MQSMTAAIMNEYFLILFIKHSFLFLIICAAYFIKSRLKHHEHGQRAEGYGESFDYPDHGSLTLFLFSGRILSHKGNAVNGLPEIRLLYL
jgi:hypothetical protein